MAVGLVLTLLAAVLSIEAVEARTRSLSTHHAQREAPLRADALRAAVPVLVAPHGAELAGEATLHTRHITYGESHSHSLYWLHFPCPLHVKVSQSPSSQHSSPRLQLSPLNRSLLQVHFKEVASQVPWPLHSLTWLSMSTNRPGQWLSHVSP